MKKKSLKNLIFGLLSFVITTSLGIVIPRMFILSYGSEINGLVNSVKQIFSYFTLLEAGVGTATQQALYGSVAKDDHKEISQILSATNHFYKRTGLIYAIAVVILAIFYPLVVKNNVPTIIVICIILFQGEAGVVKYLVTAKLQLLLNADGKNYIITNVGTIFTIFSNVARVALLYMDFGVLWVQAVFCIIDIFQVIIIVLYTRKHYGWLNLKETPKYEVLANKNSVLFHQVSGLVFNNTDTIILTYFCGLQVVSVYSMYAMFYGMVANVIGYVASSVTFALGQLFNSNRERFNIIQEIYETYFLTISFSLFTIVYMFILPFLRLYTNGVKDINYIDALIPILFLICQILDYGRKTSSNIINFACHFKQTKSRSFLETSINLVVSIACVMKFGIYGVLFGTAVALFYRTNDMILYANHVIMKRSAWPTYRRWLCNIIITILCISFKPLLPCKYIGYVNLIIYAILTSIIVIIIFLIVNTFVDSTTRKYTMMYIAMKLKSK